MDRGYCWKECEKGRWYCCWDCLHQKQCMEEKRKQHKCNIDVCRIKKEECSIYHK